MENSSVLTSNDPQPTKTGVKTGYQVLDGHISQIPGLSPTISQLSEKRAQGRMARVLESDSEYVKLAKQGGHKGLLWHEESIMSKPNSYKPPDWFGSASKDNNKPSLITSEEKKNPGAFQPLEPPFGTDNMSAWERETGSNNGKEKDNNANDSQTETFTTPDHYQQANKFKRTTHDKKPAPVNMSKLLSFGYAENNKPTQ